MGKFRIGLLCCIGTVVVALTCIYADSAESDAPENQVRDLLERVASLESKVAELEKRLLYQTLLQYQSPVIIPPAPIINRLPEPTSQPAPSGIPPGLTPNHFNGATYYVVPLANDASE